MSNTRKTKPTTIQDYNDSRTLLEIYVDEQIDPNEKVICMALDGGARIPVSRKYDLVPFKDALKEIAETLRDQNPQEIYIGNILDGEGYAKNSVHHFELWDTNFAKKMEERHKLNCADELALQSLRTALVCKRDNMPEEINQVIMQQYALVRGLNTTLATDISYAAARFFNTNKNNGTTSTCVITVTEKSKQEIWLNSVYDLYINIDKKVKNLNGFEKTAACSFLATILSCIRKNSYSTLQANPEDVGGIPKNIFMIINEHIKNNPLIVDNYKQGLITAEFIKGIEVKLNSNSLESFNLLSSNTKPAEQNSNVDSDQSKNDKESKCSIM